MDTLLVRTYEAPPVDRREIIRYMGARELTEELETMLEDCLREAESQLRYAVCWREFPVTAGAETVDLGFAKVESASLARNLAGCDRVILFAATVGLGLDRLIARYSRLQPVKGLMFQAIGTERVEALCDVFNGEIKARAAETGGYTRPRFSPGYGDLPLALQTEIFRVLDCSRKIGLSLNASLLMSPTKSVTAMIGVGRDNPQSDKEKCGACTKKDCTFREV